MKQGNVASRLANVVAAIEERLKERIEVKALAREAGLSRAVLYRLFHLVAGRPVCAYIRERRLSEAAREILRGERKLIDLALEYGYESHEAFTRAFKAQFGRTPSAARKRRRGLKFVRRLDIMAEARGQEGQCEVTEFVELKPMAVASCHVIGANPEARAWEKLAAWARKRGLASDPSQTRIYGFDNPERGAGDRPETHGYEFLMAVPEETRGSDGVAIRTFKGGRYAALKSTVRDVGRDWKRLALWLSRSEFEYDDATQWLEEHLAAGESEEEIRLKLLIPIRKAR